LPFQFNHGASAEKLLAQLAAHNWQAAMVGPHGSGKSTLLESLKPSLAALGWTIHSITLRDRERQLPRRFLCGPTSPRTLLIIDGYEQLGFLARRRLTRRCRRNHFGLLVTAHAETGFPTLVELAPDLALLGRLVAQLSSHRPSLITPVDVAASHASHGSNVREIFFDLYDLHERRKQPQRICN
jgi:hypothetical protein